jgi:8-oxo-dGTP diphosphatase
VVYRSVTTPGRLALVPGKRLTDLRWADAVEASQDARLAFDHAALIGRAVSELRDDVAALRFPPGLIEESFTLTDLQSVAAAVLGRPVDKASFRRRLEAAGCVEAVDGELRTGPFRPAQLYTLKAPEPA